VALKQHTHQNTNMWLPTHLLLVQAFRMLCRRYGAELCYTPMINSTIFVRDANYRELNADINCPDDRPLIVQFCGNDPAIMLAAGRVVQTRCDAIDINLGCPQHIARRGHYGAFLLQEV
jgi:tRNA-dihydrouridine synthase 1